MASCLNAYPQYACFDTCTHTLDASCVYARVYSTYVHMHLHVRIHTYYIPRERDLAEESEREREKDNGERGGER